MSTVMKMKLKQEACSCCPVNNEDEIFVCASIILLKVQKLSLTVFVMVDIMFLPVDLPAEGLTDYTLVQALLLFFCHLAVR